MFLNQKRSLIVLVLCSVGFGISAQIIDAHYKNNQPKENSPFSSIGLGNLAPQYYAISSAMGGLSAGFRDISSLNFENPAASTALRITAFEVGLYAKNNTISSGDGAAATSASGNLSYLALGFPTYSSINELLDRTDRKFRWSMGFALTPFSTVGYNVVTQQNHPATDTAQVLGYEIGSGGAYKILWNNGVQYKNLSLGLNLGYVFGNMSYDKQLTFNNLNNSFSNLYNQDYSIKGLTYALGAQYDISLGTSTKDKPSTKHLILGVYGNPATNFTTVSSSSLRVVSSISTGTDTINTLNSITGNGKLPSSFTAGFMYENIGKLRLGAQYTVSQWSQYQNDARPTSSNLSDSYQLSLGGEYVPNANSYKGNKLRYRLGFTTGTDPRNSGGSQLQSFSITSGIGFSFIDRQQGLVSSINLGLEYGKLSNSASALSEQYIKLNLGITLNDNTWFMKRRYQ